MGAFQILGQLRGYLRGLAKGKEPQDRLFGSADRHDLLRWVWRICRIAGVPQVCTHALQRMWGRWPGRTRRPWRRSRRRWDTRSNFSGRVRFSEISCGDPYARMAELVDAPDLGSGVERRGGSSPPPCTPIKRRVIERDGQFSGRA